MLRFCGITVGKFPGESKKGRCKIIAEYRLCEIRKNDRLRQRQLDTLLTAEGIERDAHLDCSMGLFDENDRLVAAGSCFGNTLRCLVVASDHRGEGLMARIVSELEEYQCGRGNLHLFLYTKCKNVFLFGRLGFYEVARADGDAVLMENRRDGFTRYARELQAQGGSGRQTAVVLNANPFTLGHRYLLERASAACDTLHVFVVTEDASVIPFSVRERLVKEGTADIPNVICHRTESYMISDATFPSYFLPDRDTVVRAHAVLDAAIFARIAKALQIGERYVGEEPISHVTGIYNEILQKKLTAEGIRCVILPRREIGGRAVSASEVRACLQRGDFKRFGELVPETTYDYFISEEAAPILRKLRGCGDVTHG